MSINITKLSKNFGQQKVLDDVCFDIDKNGVVGFLGPNGAGKTTTMRIIAGALPYETGSVKVCGHEVKDAPLKIKSLIGYLPEQNPLYEEMYVKEYLLFIADVYKLGQYRNKKVDEMIDKVGLRAEFRKKIGQLSKGYRQRVGLAQALIHEPKVLILDEPTTGLDPNQLEEIRTLILELGKDRTVLLSTHIMQEVKALCNRVIIINKGKIAADFEELSSIHSLNRDIFQVEVEFFKKPAAKDIENIPGVLKVNFLDETRLLIVASEDIRSEIFDFSVKQGNKILLMKLVEQEIEQVFRSLTAES
ncbi:MAG TPA: ATP-binding cassette domain-containing protein [Paludibacteraceae bacterium]|nr:ATP-binding cassette domain-containing protein [Paludibacteraceae bacterium]OPZ01636.1 MAG: putative ABC transporter ATP-binding protein YxlF [Bacteroidetes bacterium ADurb.BinA395]HOF98733.1 ATP-binding cassette domain-containing protein [Paludibacteraceae bacterium]HOJ66365.1 ATP-binding cassette domain-containing protein [Paludibacteraceae bacterium]HOL29183.1 ATP-binding cassette domain-containing protein [Paludibacteraceae bacterium]